MLALLPAALSACGNLEYEGFLSRPVPITLPENVPVVQVRFRGGQDLLTATIDSGSPLTVVDQGGSGRRQQAELRLQDALAPQVTRFVFKNPEIFDLSLRPVGLGPGIAVQSVLGVSLLRSFAVHLSYAAGGTITLKDQIADSKEDLSSDCDPALLLGQLGTRPSCLGVWGVPPSGGGLVAVGGDSLDLPSSRLVIPLCLRADAFDPSVPTETGPQQPSGVPATAVLATGQGTSIMSRSLLERLRASGATLVEKQTQTLHLPYGDETVTIVDIDRMVAVSDETIELGPCGELARRRRLLVAGRAGVQAADQDRNGASVALVQRAVTFAVLDDTTQLIQGLRQELMPFGVGDVDVVLGGSFLRYFEVDLDYPGQRAILQCAENQTPGVCEVLPFCSSSTAPRCPYLPAQ